MFSNFIINTHNIIEKSVKDSLEMSFHWIQIHEKKVVRLSCVLLVFSFYLSGCCYEIYVKASMRKEAKAAWKSSRASSLYAFFKLDSLFFLTQFHNNVCLLKCSWNLIKSTKRKRHCRGKPIYRVCLFFFAILWNFCFFSLFQPCCFSSLFIQKQKSFNPNRYKPDISNRYHRFDTVRPST